MDVLSGVRVEGTACRVGVGVSSRQLNPGDRRSLYANTRPATYVLGKPRVNLQIYLEEIPYRSQTYLFVKEAGEAPQFITKPAPVRGVVGETLQLQCKVAGKPIPSVSWFRNGLEIPIDDHVSTTISEDLLVTFIIINSKISDAGSYTVRLTNEFGQASCDVEVTIDYQEPKFTKALKDTPVFLNKPTTLDVSFTGIPRPEPQWLVAGLQISSSDKYSIHTENMTSSLELSSVTMDDTEFTYTCRAVSVVGEATTSAKLMPQVPAKILHYPDSTQVLEGTAIVLQFTIEGLPEPVVTWHKNGKVIKPGKRYVEERLYNTVTLTLKDSTVQDTATYSLTVDNSVGKDSKEVKVTVNEPEPQGQAPEFTIDLKPISVKEGEHAELRCQVKGLPEPEVKWLFNGVELQQVDCQHPVYIVRIDTATLADEGLHEVIATNPHGQAKSTAQLTVQALPKDVAPEFTEKFTDTAIEEKKNLTLTAKVTGRPEPVVTWFSNDTEIKPSFKTKMTKDGETVTLAISGMTSKMVGPYRCMATNRAGQAECQAQVTIKEEVIPPKFTTTPLKKDVKEGQKVKFEAKVKGVPTPTVQWFSNDLKLDSAEEILVESKAVKDEVTTSVSFAKVTLKDTATLKCVAVNSAGEASCQATLTVQEKEEKPVIVKKPADVEIFEQEDAVFETQVTAKPPADVQWFKGTKALAPSDKVVLKSEGDVHTLTLQNCEVKQAGTYKVQATNKLGKVTEEAKLVVKPKITQEEPKIVEQVQEVVKEKPKEVLEAPVFVETYPDTVVMEKTTLELKVKVTGIPQPEVKWYFEGQEVKPTFKTRIVTDKDGVSKLSVSGMNVKLAGVYRVVASNKAGQCEHQAKVTLPERKEPAKITKAPEDKQIKEGQKVKVDASVTGFPKPEITWYYNDEVVTISEQFKVDTKELRGEYETSLTIAELKDIAQVKVTAKNEHGEDSATAKLTIQVKKEMPKFIKKPDAVECYEYESAMFETIVSAKPAPTVEWFIADKKLEPSDKVIYDSLDSDVYRLTLKDVRKTQAGMVSVKATNESGDMSASARLKVIEVKPPKIMKPLSDTIAPENGPGAMSCQITGFPVPDVKWFLNQVELAPSDTVILEYNQKTSTYSMTVAGDIKDKAGKVRVTAKNVGGEAETEATLMIKGRAPTFVEKPLKCTILENDTAIFRCRVDGEPTPKVEWSKGKWSKITQSPGVRIYYDEAVDQHVLEMDGCGSKQAGTYTCAISNEYGSDQCPATLMVTNKAEEVEDWQSQLKKTIVIKKELIEEEVDWRSGLKFKFLRQIQDQHIVEQEFAVYECEVTRAKIPVDWYHKGTKVIPGPKYQVFEEGVVHRLAINLAEMTDIGEVKATFRKDVTTAQLMVDPILPTLTSFPDDAEVMEKDSVTFTCRVNPEHAKVKWFINNFELVGEEGKAGERRLVIKHVTRDMDGQVTVQAGNSMASAQLCVQGGGHPYEEEVTSFIENDDFPEDTPDFPDDPPVLYLSTNIDLLHAQIQDIHERCPGPIVEESEEDLDDLQEALKLDLKDVEGNDSDDLQEALKLDLKDVGNDSDDGEPLYQIRKTHVKSSSSESEDQTLDYHQTSGEDDSVRTLSDYSIDILQEPPQLLKDTPDKIKSQHCTFKEDILKLKQQLIYKLDTDINIKKSPVSSRNRLRPTLSDKGTPKDASYDQTTDLQDDLATSYLREELAEAGSVRDRLVILQGDVDTQEVQKYQRVADDLHELSPTSKHLQIQDFASHLTIDIFYSAIFEVAETLTKTTKVTLRSDGKAKVVEIPLNSESQSDLSTNTPSGTTNVPSTNDVPDILQGLGTHQFDQVDLLYIHDHQPNRNSPIRDHMPRRLAGGDAPPITLDELTQLTRGLNAQQRKALLEEHNKGSLDALGTRETPMFIKSPEGKQVTSFYVPLEDFHNPKTTSPSQRKLRKLPPRPKSASFDSSSKKDGSRPKSSLF